MTYLNRPVAALKGIGPQTANRLQKIGVHTIQDLLFHLPYRYEDRTRLTSIGSLEAGMTALVAGTVEHTDLLPNKRRDLISRISDGTGFVSLKFFHYTAGHYNNLKPGAFICCYGEVRYGFAGLEMIHPDYKVIADPDESVTESRLTPVYPLTEGLTQTVVRKAVSQALKLCNRDNRLLTDWIPQSILKNYHFPSLTEALQTLHAPDEPVASEALQQGASLALRRLAFEELLTHYLCLKKRKQQSETWSAPEFSADPMIVEHFLRSLPFKLTGAQQRVISEVTADCRRNHPMMRLVQGDVGSGKTVVSAFAALLAIDSGYQAALMAPTELLAEQHLRNFCAWFACFQANVVLLTGQSKGKHRSDILESLAKGSANIVIGTHALFQENIEFHRLGLCIIDEQHRFGVHQRLALREKGKDAGIKPHQLIMTATPIPRTLAMLHYSDLDVSVIDELPPGRKDVITSVIPAERRNEVIAKISSWAAKKRQAYWVCTLIEESDVLQCEAAEKTAERLSEALPHIRIGLIHGRM
ncbi:MAG: ATP-dependent DNA helicase RecG, partial [Gammaproteobacteria bacterium]